MADPILTPFPGFCGWLWAAEDATDVGPWQGWASSLGLPIIAAVARGQPQPGYIRWVGPFDDVGEFTPYLHPNAPDGTCPLPEPGASPVGATGAGPHFAVAMIDSSVLATTLIAQQIADGLDAAIGDCLAAPFSTALETQDCIATRLDDTLASATAVQGMLGDQYGVLIDSLVGAAAEYASLVGPGVPTPPPVPPGPGPGVPDPGVVDDPCALPAIEHGAVVAPDGSIIPDPGRFGARGLPGSQYWQPQFNTWPWWISGDAASPSLVTAAVKTWVVVGPDGLPNVAECWFSDPGMNVGPNPCLAYQTMPWTISQAMALFNWQCYYRVTMGIGTLADCPGGADALPPPPPAPPPPAPPPAPPVAGGATSSACTLPPDPCAAATTLIDLMTCLGTSPAHTVAAPAGRVSSSWDYYLPKWDCASHCSSLHDLGEKVSATEPGELSRKLGVQDSSGNATVPDWLSILNALGTPQPLLRALADMLISLLPSSMVRKQAAEAVRAVLGDGSEPDRPILPFAVPFANGVRSLLNAIEGGLKSAFAGSDCPPGPVLYYRLALSLVGILEGWVKVDLSDLRQNLEYARSYLCPTNLPDQTAADQLWLRSAITSDDWQCLTRANDNLVCWAEKVRDAARERLNANEYVQLWQRNLVSGDELDTQLRSLGWTDPADLDRLRDLASQLPSAGDLVRFMTRDSFDPEVVKKFGYDQEFEDKFQGEAADLARSAGTTPDLMRLYWRAHWELPSPTQGYEMLHRLRPEKYGPNLKFDADDLFQLLGTADMAPEFRKRLTEISYRVLTRVDARRAFNIGQLSREEFVSVLQDQGYVKADAERLVTFAERDRFKAVLSNEWVKSYLVGGVAWPEVKLRLGVLGYPAQLIQEIAEYTGAILRRNRRQKCVKAVRTRYMLGEFTVDQAVAACINLQLDTDQAVALVGEWACELQSKGKEPAASVLCSWFSRGLLGEADLLMRVRRLGYTAADAQRMVAACEAGMLDKAQRSAAAAAAKRDKQLTAAQKEAKKAQEKADREAAKLEGKQLTDRQKQLERAQKAAEKQAAARKKARLAEAASTKAKMQLTSKLAYLNDLDLPTAAVELRNVVTELKLQAGLDDQTAWAVLQAAGTSWPKEGAIELQQSVQAALAVFMAEDTGGN